MKPDAAITSPPAARDDTWRTLAEFSLPSQPGNERLAMEEVASAIRELSLPPIRVERIKTAVAGAALNAMKDGSQSRPDRPVSIRVLVSGEGLAVRVNDHRADRPISQPQVPDLEAKPAGQQPSHGWGFFLIDKMEDSVRSAGDEAYRCIELFLYLEGNYG